MQVFKGTVRRRLKELRAEAFDTDGLRTTLAALRSTFVGKTSGTIPALRETTVDYDKVRSLYYNKNSAVPFGAFVAAPIIDGTADMIGLPEINFDADVNLTATVNDWVQNHWRSAIWQMYRNTLRDTKSWVRLRLPFPDPLLDEAQQADVCILEVIDADRVTGFYDPVTQQLRRIEIVTPVFMEEQPWNPSLFAATGPRAWGREHMIHEVITPTNFYYYDETTGNILDEYTINNNWGFIPMIEVFNDYDSALHGGRSELEQAWPFIKALHELIVQTRNIHAYHADPKIQFRLEDVATFIQNNWPDSYQDGKFTGKVSWRDKDVFFMQDTEQAGFIEATLNENASVNLAEFLIDCICIAAEVTEGVLMRAKSEQTNVDTDEFFRFKKKINRKRDNFQDYIQQIVKMATKISTQQARLPKISWGPISVSDLAAEGQAVNQIVTAAEVANRAGVISKQTYQQKVRPFFPGMRDPDSETTQVNKEQDTEQKRTLDYETQLEAIRAASAGTGIGAGNNPSQAGVNGAVRKIAGREANIPLTVIAPRVGE